MFEHFLPHFAALLGLDPATLVLFLGVIVSIANLTGRLIPDTATGWLGVIRKIAKVIGLYVPNRVAPGVTNNDVVTPLIVGEAVAEPVVPAFPGLVQGIDDNFPKVN